MIGWTAVIWLVLMQLISSFVGGYLAGRLRTKWVNVHTHEVYFRDTAHGFLVLGGGFSGGGGIPDVSSDFNNRRRRGRDSGRSLAH
jgi:hypothetical protein